MAFLINVTLNAKFRFTNRLEYPRRFFYFVFKYSILSEMNSGVDCVRTKDFHFFGIFLFLPCKFIASSDTKLKQKLECETK